MYFPSRIRSSRDLEKECARNIEVMWLLRCLRPDHNKIANFRRDNPKAIKKVFRATVQIAKHFEIIGGKLIAGDSTNLRAQNSKKNNYKQAKIERHLAYNLRRIGNILTRDRLKEYLRMLVLLFLSKTGLSWSKIRLFKPSLSIVSVLNKNFFGRWVAA